MQNPFNILIIQSNNNVFGLGYCLLLVSLSIMEGLNDNRAGEGVFKTPCIPGKGGSAYAVSTGKPDLV